jgi:hypothetical protein
MHCTSERLTLMQIYRSSGIACSALLARCELLMLICFARAHTVRGFVD